MGSRAAFATNLPWPLVTFNWKIFIYAIESKCIVRDYLSIFPYNLTFTNGNNSHAMACHSFEYIEINLKQRCLKKGFRIQSYRLMMSFRRNCTRLNGVPYYYIRIWANCYATLLRKKTCERTNFCITIHLFRINVEYFGCIRACYRHVTHRIHFAGMLKTKLHQEEKNP